MNKSPISSAGSSTPSNTAFRPMRGFALGLDRVSDDSLTGTDNIRDVEAFPKNLQAVDPMSHAPTEVTQEAIRRGGHRN
jgi:aspartyl-tRNA synthetase